MENNGIQKMTFAILALIPRSSRELHAKLQMPALVRSLQNLTKVSLRHPSDVHIFKYVRLLRQRLTLDNSLTVIACFPCPVAGPSYSDGE